MKVMKNLILSLVMSVVSLVSFSQVIEIEFSKFTLFNTGMLRGYDNVIDSTNYVAVDKDMIGKNKYVFDLDNKTAKRYFNGLLAESADILTFTKKGSTVTLTMNDKETSTGKTVVSTVHLNTNKNDKTKPYYLMYFISTLTNTTNGTIVYN
jgi:hypothetical protein